MSRSPQARDAEWVRDLVERLEKPLVRYAVKFLRGDVERARDVVQDSFLRLVREGCESIGGHEAEWLFRVCRNRCLDVLRKERRMTTLADPHPSTPEAPASRGASASEMVERRGEVLALLDDLPERQQEVIRLKFLGGLSYKEISRVTELTVGNVGFLIHTGIKTIREKIERRAARDSAPDCGVAR